MEEVSIKTETINLDQFLKYAGIIESGGQVKLLLADQLILINGAIATERRKKIHHQDIIEIKGLGAWKAVAE
jgi:ribosome-associated protein